MAYVDIDLLKEEIKGSRCIMKPQYLIAEEAFEIIDNQPTADVVEVVRCKDCKHNYENGGDCDRALIHTRRNLVLEQNEYLYYKLNYCEYGERSDT